MEKTLYAGVAISNTAYYFDQLFTYRVSGEKAEQIQTGMRVVVPFGKGNRKRFGIVLSLSEQSPTQNTKPIMRILDDTPVLNAEQLAMVDYLHEKTFCTYYDAAKVLLPTGMQYRMTQQYSFHPEKVCAFDLTDEEAILVENLQSAKTVREIDNMLDDCDLPEKKEILKSLIEKEIISQEDICTRNTQDSFEVSMRLSHVFLTEGIEKTGTLTEKQKSVVSFLEEQNAATPKEICYFCGVTSAVLKNMLKKDILEQYQIPQYRDLDDACKAEGTANLILTEQQQKVYDEVKTQMQTGKPKCYLLHGVTGSGKTAVFQKLIDYTLQTGKTAMLLLPEIALTPQMVERFRKLFGNQVAVLHSGLPATKRLDAYKRIQEGKAKIVIGTRSAVFAPLEQIGLIVIDEEGERSYKSDQSPRYHAVDIAKQRCRTHQSILLLASATPSIESYYYAQRGSYTLLKMPQRYSATGLPQVQIVDMSEERQQNNFSEFSQYLIDALHQTLERGEQAILLLNRRGYHTILQCTKCRKPVQCPNCSVPMTYHKTSGHIRCHYCGQSTPMIEKCNQCGGILKATGFGTQKMEEQLKEIFPQANILRMDADTTFSRMAYEEKLRQFSEGAYQILIGTQMIGKGLDFPNVTLVGVISVDKSLFHGDFRSYEKTFSLVTQVVGRGGRGEKAGSAVLQTFMPDHYVLNLAANQDYESFYQEEISLRHTLIYPPICDICVIGFQSPFQQNAEHAAVAFLNMICEKLKGSQLKSPIRVLGPTVGTPERLNGKYRWRLLIKCKDIKEVRDFISELLTESGKKPEFAKVTVTADMNGDF